MSSRPSERLVPPTFRLPYIAPEDFILRSEFDQFDQSAQRLLTIVELFPQSDRTRVPRSQVSTGVGPVRPDWIKTVE